MANFSRSIRRFLTFPVEARPSSYGRPGSVEARANVDISAYHQELGMTFSTAQEITTALIGQLKAGAPDAVVFREFSLPSGRLDVLAITTGLHGFEIKSDFDNLDRVEAQLDEYSRYCQTLTFVGGRTVALPLLRMLPCWCGVKLAVARHDGISLLDLRLAQRNPFADARNAALLLRRDELMALTGDTRAHASRSDLRTALGSAVQGGEIRMFEKIVGSLRQRPPRGSGARRESCDGLLQPESTSSDYRFASSRSR